MSSTSSKHENVVTFDTDSGPVGIDNRCTACISHVIQDFEEPPKLTNRVITGFTVVRLHWSIAAPSNGDLPTTPEPSIHSESQIPSMSQMGESVCSVHNPGHKSNETASQRKGPVPRHNATRAPCTGNNAGTNAQSNATDAQTCLHSVLHPATPSTTHSVRPQAIPAMTSPTQ